MILLLYWMYSDRTKRNSKFILLNKLTWNLMFQIIRNFKVEYNHPMKFEPKLINVAVTPLKFKMIDREYWRWPGCSSWTATKARGSKSFTVTKETK
jgi:hypothetical protein